MVSFKTFGLMLLLIAVFFVAPVAWADDAALKQRLHDARLYIDRGGEDGLTVRQIRDILAMVDISEETRFEGELLLARALEPRSGQSIEAAVAQYRRLLRYYGKYIQESEVHFKLAKLFWSEDRYVETLGELDGVVFSEESAMRSESRLLKAKALYALQHYPEARMTLLSILSRPLPANMRCLTMAWLAAVDAGAGRDAVAASRFDKSFDTCSELIQQELPLYKAYIELLVEQKEFSRVKEHLDIFLARNFDEREALPLSLLYADMLAEKGDIEGALMKYSSLSFQNKNMEVARYAKIRHLMLLTQKPVDPYPLRSAIVGIGKAVEDAPMTHVEVEANYYKGLLFWQIYKRESAFANRALGFLTLAEVANIAPFSAKANEAGKRMLKEWLQGLAKENDWSGLISTWDHYQNFAVLEPDVGFLLANGYGQMGLYDKAFKLLDEIKPMLKQQDQAKFHLEMTKLWYFNGDPAVVSETSAWVQADDAETALAIRLMRAHWLMDQNRLEAARDELMLINMQSLGERANEYWKMRAALYEKMKDWYMASEALRHVKDEGEALDHWSYIAPQVRLLLRDTYCEKILSLLDEVRVEDRKAEWYVIKTDCVFRAGDLEASKRLLEKAKKSDDAERFALEVKSFEQMIEVEELKELRQ
ncbi:MAG: hypothetical protein HQM07_01625 [Zetaproteobacteria bacterium]|nr:hypothetical protein [Zetaproteobacteria bacterium]